MAEEACNAKDHMLSIQSTRGLFASLGHHEVQLLVVLYSKAMV